MDPLDLAKYRRPTNGEPPPTAPRRLPRHKAGEWFVQAIPGGWLGKVAKLPGRALHVGLAVWYVSGLAKGKPGKLTGKALQLFGIRRDTGYRALRRLEIAGLVRVSRKTGSCPLVSIRAVQNDVTD